MRTEMYFNRTDDWVVDISRHDNEEEPWYVVKLGDFMQQVALFMKHDQLKDLVGQAVNAMIEPGGLRCAKCDALAAYTVEYMGPGDDDWIRAEPLCSDCTLEVRTDPPVDNVAMRWTEIAKVSN